MKFVALLLLTFSISSAGLQGAISNVPNRFSSLDNECIKRWNEKKLTMSEENIKERMSDTEIGMTEFVNKKMKSIGGIIRSTWSDFRILEIRARDDKVEPARI